MAKLLNPKDYAVIGNLYNAERGIPFLIRNLLANPQIEYIIGVGATKEDYNAGSISSLELFFNSLEMVESESFIPKDIGFDCLLELTYKVQYYGITSVERLKPLIDALHQQRFNNKIYSHPRQAIICPEPELEQSEIFPGTRYGHRIEGDTIAECWVKLLHRIRKTGTIRPTGYDGQWQELIDLMVVINHDSIHNTSNLPDWFPVCEESIKNYIPQILEDKPYKEGVKYTYGQRIRSWFGQETALHDGL